MSKFIENIGDPPIYSAIQNHESKDIDPGWARYLNTMNKKINSPDFYGRPSVVLNSDFHWNAGIPASTTQADGDGAEFSEKWFVHGASVATYTLTPTLYAATYDDNIGSSYYVRFQITAYTSGSFYLYSRQTGNQFVRRYQNRPITFSTKITNDGTGLVEVQFQYVMYQNPATYTASGKSFVLQSGLNEFSDTITTASNEGLTFGAGAYSDFRLLINNINGTATDLRLQYIKVELASDATILFVDHALERARIDNS